MGLNLGRDQEYFRCICPDQWIDLARAKAGQLLHSLRDKASQWWYFLDLREVPPDNNQAERESFGHASFGCDQTLMLAVVPVQ